MEKLLKWSLENSNNASAAPEDKRQKAPDAEVLAQLFGQPDDASLMKEAMNVITDPDVDIETKETAFDNLEMLVENLDNANNLESLNLWAPLIDQLINPSPILRKMACWVIGTAVQNNPKSQAALLMYPQAIPNILNIARRDVSKEARLKAMYCLSSAIRNHEKGYESFKNAEGWKTLLQIIKSEAEAKVDSAEVPEDERHLYETDADIRRRSIFLLAGIMATEPLADKIDILRSLSAVPSLLDLLHVEGSSSAIEKVVQVLLVIAKSEAGFTDEEKEEIKKGLERSKKEGLLDLEEPETENTELMAEWRQLEEAIK
ncbi:Hsp70 nucleotide exchange factor FES1 [Myxozyma melibiosi]|uniref:Hsp70 nucleotide exchange factor FES1 n=1 Tax=Myxozyma melibiosi TaxID=54550 RepID=A0ABR1F8N0_9ASCO